MNERIRELAEQAGWMMGDEVEGFNTRLEKFAGLLIRECCQYLDSEAERLYTLSASEQQLNFKEDFEICAEKCYDNIQGIKDHFGVGE